MALTYFIMLFNVLLQTQVLHSARPGTFDHFPSSRFVCMLPCVLLCLGLPQLVLQFVPVAFSLSGSSSSGSLLPRSFIWFFQACSTGYQRSYVPLVSYSSRQNSPLPSSSSPVTSVLSLSVWPIVLGPIVLWAHCCDPFRLFSFTLLSLCHRGLLLRVFLSLAQFSGLPHLAWGASPLVRPAGSSGSTCPCVVRPPTAPA